MNQQLVRLGVFTTLGLVIIVGFSFFVNDEPYWYRACNSVDITVDDATGLRRKSPVKTLGLDIGYIRSVDLDGNSVVINVCVTAPVKLRADTKAYVRSIGFLGDRFLELKPVDVHTDTTEPVKIKKVPAATAPLEEATPPEQSSSRKATLNHNRLSSILDYLIAPAAAEDAFAADAQAAGLISTAQAAPPKTTTLQASREAEITDTMKKVGKLVDELTLLVRDVREATSQVEFKDLVVNLNESAKNLATLLEPKGSITQNIRKSMDSLHGSLKELEEAMQKVNQGKGTLGKLINDDKLYDEAVAAVKGLNLLLGKAGNLRVYIDLSAHTLPAYNTGKGLFLLKIEPNPTRYYLLGISTDPIGTQERTTTQYISNSYNYTEQKIVTNEKGLQITAALGKYFGPLDLKVGLLEGAAGVGAGYWLDEEHAYGLMTEVYKASKEDPIKIRIVARAQVFMGLYLKAGAEDVKKVGNQYPYFFGAGLYFNDEDIKYLLAFK